MKGKMEITIGVSVGSSIQIAAGMIPILVLAAWPLKKDLTLYFADFEVSCLAASGIRERILMRTTNVLDICRPSCSSFQVRDTHSVALVAGFQAHTLSLSNSHARQHPLAGRQDQLHRGCPLCVILLARLGSTFTSLTNARTHFHTQ